MGKQSNNTPSPIETEPPSAPGSPAPAIMKAVNPDSKSLHSILSTGSAGVASASSGHHITPREDSHSMVALAGSYTSQQSWKSNEMLPAKSPDHKATNQSEESQETKFEMPNMASEDAEQSSDAAYGMEQTTESQNTPEIITEAASDSSRDTKEQDQPTTTASDSDESGFLNPDKAESDKDETSSQDPTDDSSGQEGFEKIERDMYESS